MTALRRAGRAVRAAGPAMFGLGVAALALLFVAGRLAIHGHWMGFGTFGFCGLVYGAFYGAGLVVELRRIRPEAERH